MIRVKTEIRISAWLRECQAAGSFATIVRKGDADAGIVAIKVFASNGEARGMARAFLETRDFEGNQAFRELTDGLMPETEADACLQKQTKFDSDLWIVEIENRDGDFFMQDLVLKG